jgi:hypothetical protein
MFFSYRSSIFGDIYATGLNSYIYSETFSIDTPSNNQTME